MTDHCVSVTLWLKSYRKVNNAFGVGLRNSCVSFLLSLVVKGLKVVERYIWIEAAQRAPGQWDPADCNSDVMVSFRDGAEWVATFFRKAAQKVG